MLRRSNAFGWLLPFALTTAGATSGCSTMPPASVPEHQDYELDYQFVVLADGKLPFPMTTREVVVRSLTLDPEPANEHFEAQQRWFAYAPDTVVRVRGQLRVYGPTARHGLAGILQLPIEH